MKIEILGKTVDTDEITIKVNKKRIDKIPDLSRNSLVNLFKAKNKLQVFDKWHLEENPFKVIEQIGYLPNLLSISAY